MSTGRALAKVLSLRLPKPSCVPFALHARPHGEPIKDGRTVLWHFYLASRKAFKDVEAIQAGERLVHVELSLQCGPVELPSRLPVHSHEEHPVGRPHRFKIPAETDKHRARLSKIQLRFPLERF